MISYPFVALAVGWFIYQLKEKVSIKPTNPLIFLMFFIPFIFSVENTLMFIRKDTRNILHEYVEEFNSSRENPYKIYYSSTNLKQVLPEGSKRIEDVFGFYPLDPSLLIRECNLESPPGTVFHGIFHYISNSFRRGPEICIYESVHL